MRFLPILCLFLLPSCIAAQLAETEAHILGALEDHRDATFETYEAYQSGVITQDEPEEELDEIREERDQSVEEAWENLTDHVESEIQRVKATATTAAGGILGGGPLVDLLAAIGPSSSWYLRAQLTLLDRHLATGDIEKARHLIKILELPTVADRAIADRRKRLDELAFAAERPNRQQPHIVTGEG